jgi:hypothetical protein
MPSTLACVAGFEWRPRPGQILKIAATGMIPDLLKYILLIFGVEGRDSVLTFMQEHSVSPLGTPSIFESLLGVPEAAKLLQIHSKTLQALARRAQYRAYVLGNIGGSERP